ncbi:MAG: hypothetical protein AB1758_34125, partial [Candidatus Eremiobacterota bacterium]
MSTLLQPPPVPAGAPPQLRLLLLGFQQAMEKNQANLAQKYLWACLEHMVRLFAGLVLEALEFEGLRSPTQLNALKRGAGSLEGVAQVLTAGLTALGNQPRTRRCEQMLETFFRWPSRALVPIHTRWVGAGGPPTDLPFLTDWQPQTHTDILDEAVRLYLPVLTEWLDAAEAVFSEEDWSLERELQVVLAPVEEAGPAGPEPTMLVPEDPLEVEPERLDEAVAFWSQIILSPQRGDEGPHTLALSHLVLAFRRRAASCLWRNLFELAEREYENVVAFCHKSEGLKASLADGLSGRGRARGCLGYHREAVDDLEDSLAVLRQEAMQRGPSREGAHAMARTLFYRAVSQ